VEIVLDKTISRPSSHFEGHDSDYPHVGHRSWCSGCPGLGV